jgi:hypothetical protein
MSGPSGLGPDGKLIPLPLQLFHLRAPYGQILLDLAALNRLTDGIAGAECTCSMDIEFWRQRQASQQTLSRPSPPFPDSAQTEARAAGRFLGEGRMDEVTSILNGAKFGDAQAVGQLATLHCDDRRQLAGHHPQCMSPRAGDYVRLPESLGGETVTPSAST